MGDEVIRMLVKAIEDYTKWAETMRDQKRRPMEMSYHHILMDFVMFAINRDMTWEELFTLDTLEAFSSYSRFKKVTPALIGLCSYLYNHRRIDHPLETPRSQRKDPIPLPELYEEFLHRESLGIGLGHLRAIRRMLEVFHAYLENNCIELSALTIEDLDTFMASFKVSRTTRRTYRHNLRSFLTYLYHEKKLLRFDLASLLVGAPEFNRKKPPKFLRPQEVKQLFSSLNLSIPRGIRTYAMVHLAYSLGLRPIEISKISLDDISFTQALLTIRERKSKNPLTLPLPEKTLKGIAAYVLKARAETHLRHLFLTCHRPYRPLNRGGVACEIRRAMRKAGLSSSSYWLRHTYAQNLLHLGRSIYEIKEMMGHTNIQSTQRYLSIDTDQMRKVLFDETL